MKRLAHLSDLHFGRIDARVVAGLLADLVHTGPDGVVISGDLVQRAKPDHFAMARAFLEELPFPYLVVPGNHDIPVYNLIKRFTDPFRLYRRWISADLSPFHVDDDIAILGLTTARAIGVDFTAGRINRAQIARIRDVFDPLPDRLFKIVFAHHPFLPPPDAPDTPLVGRHGLALSALESCGVDLILSGHLHRAYTGDAAIRHPGLSRSILASHAATATSTRLRGEANAYTLITVDPPRVSFRLRVWDGDRFTAGSRSDWRKDTDRWVLDAEATLSAP